MAGQGRAGPYRVPVLGEVIGIMDEEVTAIDMDEGAKAQVLGPIALLPPNPLVAVSHSEVLHPDMPFIVCCIDMHVHEVSGSLGELQTSLTCMLMQ